MKTMLEIEKAMQKVLIAVKILSNRVWLLQMNAEVLKHELVPLETELFPLGTELFLEHVLEHLLLVAILKVL